jgi:cbb3-type cytochrome oxidase subunit 3
MWGLNPRNWHHFCNTDDEWHSIVMGLCFPIVLWWPVSRYQVGEAARLLQSEPWYVAFGTFLRALAFIGILIWQGVL